MHVDLTVVMDRSGSMLDIAEPMKRGFDKFMDEQRGIVSSLLTVTLVQFDNMSIDTVYTEMPSDKVPKLVLQPGASTPLYDAIGRTIMATGKRYLAKDPKERPDKVIFMIITDGLENASQEFGLKRVQKMIAEQRTKYSWEFIFLGANIDSYAVGGSLNISQQASANYLPNSSSIKAVYTSMSENMFAVREGQKADMSFTAPQKQAMDPSAKTKTPKV